MLYKVYPKNTMSLSPKHSPFCLTGKCTHGIRQSSLPYGVSRRLSVMTKPVVNQYSH